MDVMKMWESDIVKKNVIKTTYLFQYYQLKRTEYNRIKLSEC